MGKEFCECGHSKKVHLIEGDRDMCCSMWQSRKTGWVVGCECPGYKPEQTSHKQRSAK